MILSLYLIKKTSSEILFTSLLGGAALYLLLITSKEFLNKKRNISQVTSHFGFSLFILSILRFVENIVLMKLNLFSIKLLKPIISGSITFLSINYLRSIFSNLFNFVFAKSSECFQFFEIVFSISYPCMCIDPSSSLDIFITNVSFCLTDISLGVMDLFVIDMSNSTISGAEVVQDEAKITVHNANNNAL